MIRVRSRFLPWSYPDALLAAAALLFWQGLMLTFVFFAIATLDAVLKTDIGSLQFMEFARFIGDALSDYVGVMLPLTLILYGVARWARTARTLDLTPQGLRFNRRLGKPFDIAWDGITTIDLPAMWRQFLAAMWPAFPSRFASFTASARQYRIRTPFRVVYFTPTDPQAFENGLARWHSTTPAESKATPFRAARRGSWLIASPLITAGCLALVFAVFASTAKFVTEDVEDGAKYGYGPLLRAFALKPGADAPEAARALLIAGVKAGNVSVVRTALQDLSSIREAMFPDPLVELAVRGMEGRVDRNKAKNEDPLPGLLPAFVEHALNNLFSDPHWRARERAEIIAVLVAHGAHIEPGALLEASLRGEKELFAALVRAGAPLDDVDRTNGIPDIAIAAGHSAAALELFLAAGADPNQTGDEGETALFDAARTGMIASMDLLIAKGARVDARNHADATPLMAVLHSRMDPKARAAVIERLLAGGADLNAVDRAGYTMAHAAAFSGDIAFLERVIANGARYTAKTADGETLLHSAVSASMRSNNIAMIRHLIAKGLDVNAANVWGRTPLFQAGAAAVAALLESGANVNARDKSGTTALHHAAQESDAERARTLLNNGARKDIADNEGRLPRDYYRPPPRKGKTQPKNDLAELLTP